MGTASKSTVDAAPEGSGIDFAGVSSRFSMAQ